MIRQVLTGHETGRNSMQRMILIREALSFFGLPTRISTLPNARPATDN
jgi:hypothetical protein